MDNFLHVIMSCMALLSLWPRHVGSVTTVVQALPAPTPPHASICACTPRM